MAKILPRISNERLAELTWYGPFLLRNGKVVEHPLEPAPLPPDSPGLYLAIGAHPLYGEHVLLYIGQTGRLLSQRLSEHTWLRDEWRLEVYVTDVEDVELRAEVEALLIYAHTPLYNSSRLAETSRLKMPLRLWNQGRFWGLYPEISSEHNWMC